MDTQLMRFTALIAAAAVVATAAGAGAQRAASESAAPVARPLAPFAARRVLVLPTHALQSADTLGWAAQISDPGAYLREVDAEIAYALADRGVKRRWVFPEALAASAKRNPGYAPDPYDLAAHWLRPPLRKAPDELPEPFASQIRTLIALQEDAQYVLLPVEIRFESVGPSAGRAVLNVALIDARRAQIVWLGDVLSDPAASFSPSLAASTAEHLADLIAAR
jgi:hypothetical protein